MRNKNEFIKRYTELPTKEDIRIFIMGITIFVNVCDYCVIWLYDYIIPYSTIPNTIITLLMVITFCFDLFSIIFYTFPTKMDKLINLYTAIAFTGSSIFYFSISSLVFLNELDSPLSYLIVSISILVYILMIVAVIFNIRNKIKKAYIKRQPNKIFVTTISSLCISIGIIIAKQTELNDIPFAILLLVLAYSLIPTCSGFHKFYLIIKEK